MYFTMHYLLCIVFGCDCFSQENTLSIAVLPFAPPPPSQFIVVFFNALCPGVRLVPCQERSVATESHAAAAKYIISS